MAIFTKVDFTDWDTCNFHHCHILKNRIDWRRDCFPFLHWMFLRLHVNERFSLEKYCWLNMSALNFHRSIQRKIQWTFTEMVFLTFSFACANSCAVTLLINSCACCRKNETQIAPVESANSAYWNSLNEYFSLNQHHWLTRNMYIHRHSLKSFWHRSQW